MKRFGLTELFCGLVLVAILADAALTKKQRLKREAEVAENVQVDRELHRTKRLDLTSSGHEKTLSRVKRLEDERELKRYKRQKRHIVLIKKALEHVKKRSVSAAELKELLRVKRTKRNSDSGRALSRMKRGKSKSNKVHKRAKKSLKRGTITKRDIQLARALLRKKRTEHIRNLNAVDDKARTMKKDKNHGHQSEKKHHVRRHKKFDYEKSDSKAHEKEAQSAVKKSKKHVNKKEHALNRVKRK